MKKLFIVGPKRMAAKVLLNLQQAGVVQVDELPTEELDEYRLDPEEETLLKKWEAIATSADHASSLLGLELHASVEPSQDGVEETQTAASSYEQQVSMLVEKRQSLEDVPTYRPV
jgi:V/A-type H+-transporting ATPase subunit I